MARGTQFLTLISALRNETGRSTQAGSSGLADFNQLKRLLNKHYETLYYDYDWPHLRRVFDRIPLNAGQRHYDLPASLDYERIEQAHVWHSGLPLPIDRGITFEEYAAFSSEDDDRSGPVQKWDIRHTGVREQIEVWPMPSEDDAQELQFQGFVKFTPLVSDSDVCLLDDNLVVGFAAAEIALAQGAKDAQLKLNAAQNLYNRLRGRTKGGGKIYRFGDAETAPQRPRFNVVVS